MVGEHVLVQIRRYRDAAQPTVLVSVRGQQGLEGSFTQNEVSLNALNK